MDRYDLEKRRGVLAITMARLVGAGLAATLSKDLAGGFKKQPDLTVPDDQNAPAQEPGVPEPTEKAKVEETQPEPKEPAKPASASDLEKRTGGKLQQPYGKKRII